MTFKVSNGVLEYKLNRPMKKNHVIELRRELSNFECNWGPSLNGYCIRLYNVNSTFNNTAEWFQIIVDNYLKPWGYIYDSKNVQKHEDYSDVILFTNTSLIEYPQENWDALDALDDK